MVFVPKSLEHVFNLGDSELNGNNLPKEFRRLTYEEFDERVNVEKDISRHQQDVHVSLA